jgi:hypothetical protein
MGASVVNLFAYIIVLGVERNEMGGKERDGTLNLSRRIVGLKVNSKISFLSKFMTVL